MARTTHTHSHNHSPAALLAKAEAHCAARGARFTPQRRAVFELLLGHKKPIGAYDLLALYQKKHKAKLAPPIIYRALDFLVEAGLVTKLETRNLFVPCAHPDDEHQCLFFVCGECGDTLEAEIPAIDRALEKSAREAGFAMEKRIIEVEGRCRACQAHGR